MSQKLARAEHERLVRSYCSDQGRIWYPGKYTWRCRQYQGWVHHGGSKECRHPKLPRADDLGRCQSLSQREQSYKCQWAVVRRYDLSLWWKCHIPRWRVSFVQRPEQYDRVQYPAKWSKNSSRCI